MPSMTVVVNLSRIEGRLFIRASKLIIQELFNSAGVGVIFLTICLQLCDPCGIGEEAVGD